MSNFILRLLSSALGLSSEVEISDWRDSPVEGQRGIHLLSGNGCYHELISDELSEQKISDILHELDWEQNFYQLVVTTEPGVSMEVGGCLNGIDGLSARYLNRHNDLALVIDQPPESVEQMQQLMHIFLQPGDLWRQRYNFSG